MTVETIPATAWVQAVFVCLFIVYAAGMQLRNDKQIVDIRKSHEMREKEWQSFIGGLEEKWRQFLRDERSVYGQARREDNQRMERIESALGRLAEETAQFRQDFSTHATEEMTRYDTIMEMTRKNDQAARKSRGSA